MNKRERISQWLAEATGEDVNPDQDRRGKTPVLPRVFRCWNEQRYYEAHDVLEQLWLNDQIAGCRLFQRIDLRPPGPSFIFKSDSSIRCTRSTAERLPPAVRLFRLANKNLSRFAPRHHGLNVAAFCQLLRGFADRIVESDYKTNPWSPETAPKLRLPISQEALLDDSRAVILPDSSINTSSQISIASAGS